MGGEDLVIAIAQDWQTNDVLMVAFMNKEAVEQTLKTKKAHYYSTSRQKQWLKGWLPQLQSYLLQDLEPIAPYYKSEEKKKVLD